MSSLAAQFANLSSDDALADISDEIVTDWLYDWEMWARDKQKEPPGDWSTWLILAGRGFGKTRTGAEFTKQRLSSGKYGRWALVGRTAADVRDVMVEGESGILACSHPRFKPKYEPSKRRLTWPNGATATTYSADEPDLLRGPQNDGFWADELAAWQYDQEAWDNLMFGTRLGPKPQGIVTTTPRPTKLVKTLVSSSTTYVTRGNTYENRANLAESFFTEIIKRYEGTRIGRQELLAEILDDVEGALWKRDWIERNRVVKHTELKRIVVGVDPPATSKETSDDPAECGIVVAGLGMDNHGYVLADSSLIGTPHEWASAAITAYNVWQADRIIAEINFGGEMVEAVIRSVANEKKLRNIPVKTVRASRGKLVRAEPVSNLYEQNLVHHVGAFPLLEDQQCGWLPGEKSPDCLDAGVWAISELMVGNAQIGGMVIMHDDEAESQDVDEEDLTLWR